MTRDDVLTQLRIGPGINEDVSEEYNDAVNAAIEDVETMQEFENLHLITGGRLNGRAYAYKCGLEEGKRKALDERKKEKWIEFNWTDENGICHWGIKCPKCLIKYKYRDYGKHPNYCPNCGTPMEV